MSHYKIDDKKLASVTTIISDCSDKSGALTQWAANMVVEWIKENAYETGDVPEYLVGIEELNLARFNFRDVSKTALDVGSKVHQAIEDYFNLGKEPINPEPQVLAAFVAFLEWVDEHDVKCDDAELTVTDGKSAGTLDFVGEIDGVRTVVDFKSSKAIYPEYRYQIAAYKYMYNLYYFELKADRCGILRLDKETGYSEYKDTTKTYEKDLNVYHKMVELFYARHPRLRKQAKL